MEERQVLAVDLGASGGRVILGRFDGEKIEQKELHRFDNDPVFLNGTMYWDFLRLIHEIKQGLIKAKPYGKIDSIGVDTWGVDFGLIDRQGNLLENPVHYRDKRTEGMMERAENLIPEEEFYGLAGTQMMEINTVYQLMALGENRPGLLERADRLLMMPDLINFYLCGKACTEYSMATTTQLLDVKSRCWSKTIMERLGLPERIFQEVVPSGTRLDFLRKDICEELDLGAEQEAMEVIAVAGHDTQCAMAAVPAKEKDFIFLSCGTWSLFGTELDTPIVSGQARKGGLTNEGGYGGKISFLKNIIGTWLIQESRRQWMREGKRYSYGELEELALEAAKAEQKPPCIIDPEAPEFVPAGNMPKRIREYAQRTGQKPPLTPGEVVRCINESLAVKFAETKKEIEACTGKKYEKIFLVGGGAQSAMLCQLTADRCGCQVDAGPVEATVLGNMGIQLLTLGAVEEKGQLRDIVRKSADIKSYRPRM